jgi:hypothetical protein
MHVVRRSSRPGTAALTALQRGRGLCRRRRPGAWLSAGVGVALLATTMVFGSPASAAVPGLERISATTAADSVGGKTVVARCPSGKVTIGAGGFVTGAYDGDVFISQIRPGSNVPNTLFDRVTVSAFEDANGTALNWAVTAIAICVNNTPGLGLERVLVATPFDSLSPKVVSANCPAGKRVVGTGGIVSQEGSGPGGPVPVPGQRVGFIDHISPTTTLTPLTRVRVNAYEPPPNGTTSNWSLTAIAICAYPPPGLQPVSVKTAADSAGAKTGVAICPIGKTVIGAGGGRVSGALGQIAVQAIAPSTGGGRGNVTVAALEHEATADQWAAEVFAICAFP